MLINHEELKSSITLKQKKIAKEISEPIELSEQRYNERIYSITEISFLLKRKVEKDFGNIKVIGEVSNLKAASSGHTYFNLKDEGAVINAICWRSIQLPIKLEEGLKITCTGSLTIYPERSVYQLLVKKVELSGVGALLTILEERKRKLTELGIFSIEKKKKLPFLPKVIGIVTSLHGAVIKDILHRISDRFPVHILIWSVLVQGSEAAEQIATAIKGFCSIPENLPKPNLLIIARGGGSLEDLWPFNEEIVVRAIAESNIPTISAIGHETDTTLADLAADCRAPTPTAAAEISTPVITDLNTTLLGYKKRSAISLRTKIMQLKTKLENLQVRLTNTLTIVRHTFNVIERSRLRLRNAMKNLLHKQKYRVLLLQKRFSPQQVVNIIAIKQQKLLHNRQIIDKIVTQHYRMLQQKLQHLIKFSISFGYKETLKRGFSVIRNATNNNVISEAVTLKEGDRIIIEFRDGKRNATIVI